MKKRYKREGKGKKWRKGIKEKEEESRNEEKV